MPDTPRIAVLPDHVIDQIAAGEVVERPASVVKELVDNAIDAGARTITIEVDGGGKRLVRVVDDGGGMSPAEARLALARHATSKLRVVDDLWDLTTLGFRGEALPAIASVSRLTLTTRRAGDLAATRLRVVGGEVIDDGLVGAPCGTIIEVEDLLYNVPARQKFMKGDATEASHINETVARLALAYPAVHLRLRHGGRTAVDTPPVADPLDRVRDVLGPRVAAAMIAVHGEDAGIRVQAFLAPPDLAQATARGVQLFVGRRPVRDRGLLHAVAMGYGELVPRGRYPVAVIAIDVPAGGVDVNVHPQKLEVRFGDPAAVATAVRHVVRKGVASAPWTAAGFAAAPVQIAAMASLAPPTIASSYVPSALAGRHARVTSVPAQGSLGLEPAVVAPAAPRAESALHASDAGGGAVRTMSGGAGLPPGAAGASWAERMRAQLALRADVRAADRAVGEGVPDDDRGLAAGSGAATVPGYFSRLRYLGQLDRTYLVCEGDGELVLVDQHAAHERVELQRLRERAQAADPSVQRLLFPTTIEASPARLAAAATAGPLLAAVGFEVEPFGKSSLAIKAVPAGLRQVDPAQVLAELLGELAERDVPRDAASHHDDLLATIACHSVVRAGDLLGEHEARALLAAMDAIDFRLPGRHGRPVLLRLGIGELARRFGR